MATEIEADIRDAAVLAVLRSLTSDIDGDGRPSHIAVGRGRQVAYWLQTARDGALADPSVGRERDKRR